MKKITLFIGTERGFNVLKSLIENKYTISSVLILEQKPHELNNFTKKIIELSKKNKISYKTTKEIKPSSYKSFLEKSNPDVVFVVSWRYLISEACFNIPKNGIYVLHDSLLPKYRGFSPTNWVIINREKITGLTLQKISVDMDAGEIADQIKLKISPKDNASSLNDKFLKIYPEIILNNVDKILSGKIKLKKQNNKIASYGTKRLPDDGRIDFHSKTDDIISLIRGLSYPYPGAFCTYNNHEIILWEGEKINNPPFYVGKIVGKIAAFSNQSCDVLTIDGMIRVNKIALRNKPNKFLTPKDYFKHIGGTLK